MSRQHRRTSMVAAGFLLAGAVGVAVLFLLPRSTARAWIAEPGPLQGVTVVLLALVAARYWLSERRAPAAAGGGLLLLLALVKLDPGGWIPLKEADSATFYASGGIPAVKKGIAAAVLLLGAALTWLVAREGWGRFRRGLREGRMPARLVALAMVLFLVTLALDRIEESMVWPHPGYSTHPELLFGVEAAESVLEFLVPVALLGALGGRPRAG